MFFLSICSVEDRWNTPLMFQVPPVIWCVLLIWQIQDSERKTGSSSHGVSSNDSVLVVFVLMFIWQATHSCGRSLRCTRCPSSCSERRSRTGCSGLRVHIDWENTWEQQRQEGQIKVCQGRSLFQYSALEELQGFIFVVMTEKGEKAWLYFL